MKVAISLLTCDRLELTKQSIAPLLAGARNRQFDLFVVDGSIGEENEKALWDIAYPTANVRSNIRGGAGSAIVYALTEMLAHEENYDVVGLLENDVLVGDDWFERSIALLDIARQNGLVAGAVSARCYEDRVLFQCGGFAVMHNLGAGCIMLTREAAQIVLKTFRTGWTSDNRRIFCQLAGLDLASYWAFRTDEHALTADWHWDASLAAHGLASLALTPSPVSMIGQNPPIAEQGLTIAEKPIEARIDDAGLGRYRQNLLAIYDGAFRCGVETKFFYDPNTSLWTAFAHQIPMLGGLYSGDWRRKEVRGWGTFAWEATGIATIDVPAFGSVAVLVSGGKSGGKVEVTDAQTGFKTAPDLKPEGSMGEVLQLVVPGGMVCRKIKITALTPGVGFYGLQSRERQPEYPDVSFDYSRLPAA